MKRLHRKDFYFKVLSHLYSWSCWKSLCETYHAHVICVLFQATCALVTAVQTWEAGLLVFDSSTGVSTRVGFTAGLFCILLNEKWGKTILTITTKLDWQCNNVLRPVPVFILAVRVGNLTTFCCSKRDFSTERMLQHYKCKLIICCKCNNEQLHYTIL